ncbi:MAG: NFACT family protein [Ignavibacteriaceae bacterium]|nr:NFACT family protein [Ignavibacteriaceae bacterium]
MRKKYPVLGTDIIKEVKSRSNDNSNLKLENILKGVLEEIRISSPCVFADESAQEIKLGFENFKSIPFTEKFLFKNVIEAQNFLLSKKYYVDSRSERLKLIKQSLDREINKISNRLNSLNGILERGSKEAEYNQNGNLLLTNISKIKAGMNNITVDNIFGDDIKIQIALNPKLSPQKNIDYYFEKSKSERTLIAKTQELVKN